MTAFLRWAEEILLVATNDNSVVEDKLVVLDRQGGIRILDPKGWLLPALAAEFGAVAVYKVERRGGSVRVEGWNGWQRCLLQGQTSGDRARSLLGEPFTPYATRLQFPAALALT